MDRFVADFASYRLDEVLGAWKPYVDVLKNAVRRTCKTWGLAYSEAEGQAYYDAVPTWVRMPTWRPGLVRIAAHIPLVILSNASNDQIQHNVAKLGAPFHAVFTAEQAQAYKPRMQAFEYMLDQLGCAPRDILHVSSSLRYDLMTAHDLGIENKVFVNRGHDPVGALLRVHRDPGHRRVARGRRSLNSRGRARRAAPGGSGGESQVAGS